MTNAQSSRSGLAWARVRDSLWFLPRIAVLVGSALAVLAVCIETFTCTLAPAPVRS